MGRWTQQDPLNQVGDLREANRYTCVGGDPINETDPSGLHSGEEVSGACASGEIYGAAAGAAFGLATAIPTGV